VSLSGVNGPAFLDFWEKGCKYSAVRGQDGEKLEFNQMNGIR
jgi:lactoylglutathione lyase